MIFLTFIRCNLLVLLILVCMSIDKCFTKIKKFDFNLQSIVVNNDSIYIGGTNFLQRLSYDLVELAKVKTGPKLYSPYCINTAAGGINCPADIDKDKVKTTDSVNNILLLTEQPKPSLLACSNLNQGECKFYSLDTLTDFYSSETLRYISANEDGVSTVATISNLENSHPLFVVKSIKNVNTGIKNRVYSIAVRQLKDEDELLQPYQVSGQGTFVKPSSNILIDYSGQGISRAKYNIAFKSIYTVGNNIFVTSMHEHAKPLEYQAKIMQFSVSTKLSLRGYIEQPLACSSSDTTYNILHSTSLAKLNTTLAATFGSNNGTDHILFGLFSSTGNPGKYAVCSYFLSSISKEFDKQLTSCAKANDIPVAEWLDDATLKCTAEFFNRYNVRLAPNTSLSGEVLLVRDGTLPSGTIQALVHERGLALYLSSDKSTLQGFSVTPKGKKSLSLHQFNVKDFGINEVFYQMVIDPSLKYIFMISANNVVRSNIDDCLNRKSCFDCLSGPYCGWCTLSNKCTFQSECTNTDKPSYFISENTDKCPAISNVTPNVTSVNTVSKLSFTATNVPTDVNYQCKINDLILEVENVNSKFSCAKFDFSTIRPFNPLQGSSEVDVSLIAQSVVNGNNIVIATSQFTMYSCEEFKMCKSCITGQFFCGWCARSLSCFENQNDCADSNTWISYQGYNSTAYQDICPSVQSSPTTFVSYDDEVEITLNGKTLPAPTDKYAYSCQFLFDGNTEKSQARHISDTEVICGKSKFSYGSELKSIQAKVNLLYGDVYIDTSDLSVSIYKCHVERPDCSICLSAPVEWKCGWCKNSTQCTIAKTCTLAEDWMNSKCPVPVINSFTPLEASSYGGTKITIRGNDFGLSIKDVISVTLAGEACDLIPEEYVTSQQIVCNTTAIDGQKNGKVIVTINSAGGRVLNGSSSDEFYFRIPGIYKVHPTRGPCSGGTIITLQGAHLNVGNSVRVVVNSHDCVFMNRTSSSIICKTKASTVCSLGRKRRRRATGDGIKVSFDGYEVTPLAQQTFTYVVDPIVALVYTNKRSIDLKTLVSGGQVFIVEGQRFDTISVPQMLFTVYSPPMLKKSVCDVKNALYMTCLGPNMSDANIKSGKKLVLLGFEMDNVASIQKYRNFSVFPDPIFDKFVGDDNTLIVKNEDLVLTGKYLDVLNKKDVNVTVGGTLCTVTDLDKRLSCTLAPKDEILKSANGQNIAVKITVGEGGLSYNVGFIKFYIPMEDDALLIYILLPTAFVLILLIVAIVLCIWHRRRKRKEKEYEQLVQVKLDKIESQYARECKEAFAAYQTEITDLTLDVDQYVSQYLDFKQYAMRVLYPGLASHPILETNRDESPEWETCMVSFIGLLKEKDFLLTFVRTLENQSSFQMTDRCIVASLLTVSLQDDLQYITEILMILLKDLINKGGSSKRPKLLLRRTESVAEKLLTNWLAYTLHSFLDENVGEPLFKLYTAITILLDKEPIDAVTFDARNSLSEDKLLRQKMEFNPITLNVEYIYPTDKVAGGQYDKISVLTCDTISQTKEKILKIIYKNKPYSDLPLPSDLQLGFTSPNGACLVLKDEDTTNVVEGEWKKINTLEHYKVPENSHLRLEPIADTNVNQSSSFATAGGTPQVTVTSPRLSKFQSSKRKFNASSARSMQDLDQSQNQGLLHETSMGSIFQPSHASTPMLHHNHHDHREPKLWHMVKHTDYPQEQKEDVKRDVMAEVYLTRLLKTKETLHSFVNRLFDSIFGLNEGGERIIPASVKYLFDFLDEQAEMLEIDSNEVHHTWKNNSLPLRFWINMIKNPNFVFDINKSNTVDSCLSVIAQLFMDSCSPDEHRLGKDSPSNKLLYAKEIPEYKRRVQKFYVDVKETSYNGEDFENSLNEISTKYGKTFNSCNAASELMTYAIKYKVKIWDNLEDNGYQKHADKLQDIMENIPDD